MNKKQALNILPDIIKSAKTKTHRTNLIVVPEMSEFTKAELMELEYATLGFYLKDNPLDSFRNRLAQLCTSRGLHERTMGAMVAIGGRVVEVRKTITKHGREMAILKLEDFSGKIEVVIFPNIYPKYRELIEQNKILEIEGKVDVSSYFIKNEEIHVNKVITTKITEMEEINNTSKATLILNNKPNLEEIHKILLNNKGTIPVDISISNLFVARTDLKVSHKGLRELERSIPVERTYEDPR